MLTLSSIFSSSDFIDEGFDRPRWCQGHASNDSSTSSYTTLRKYQQTPNTDISHENISEILLHSPYDQNPTTLVNITQLIPMNMTSPLVIDDYILSPDHTKVLLFTNSQKVWRLKTKGSYWILLLNDSNSKPYQLGLTLSNPNQLMFATFSPSYTKVAYVLEHNIYCEDILTHQITQLTFDGNENIINGTFDWVYEEEFHLRNGFRYVAFFPL